MQYWANIGSLILIFSVFSISLNLLLGYTGQVSVAHAAFGAVGGYTAAYISVHYGIGFWPGLLLGTLGAGLVGILVALPALRLSPEYLILLTIAFSSIVLAIVTAVDQLGGAYGIIANTSADLSPLPGGVLLNPSQWLLPLACLVALTYLVCRRMGESAWGRVLRGIRDDEVAVRALGRNIVAFKVVVFGLTAAFAGLAGVLLFYFDQLVSPDVYSFDVSMAILAMVIFGGLGNFVGSIFGAAVIELLQPLLDRAVKVDPSKSFFVQLVIYGTGLALLMRVRPQGLIPEGTSLLALAPRVRLRPASAAAVATPTAIVADGSGTAALALPGDQPPSGGGGDRSTRSSGGLETTVGRLVVVPTDPAPNPPERTACVLEVRGLQKRFGGIVPCRDLDLQLEHSLVTALVGPNGAGKTTVFNLLTGMLRPDAGSVQLRGTELVGLRPDEIVHRGMVRSFQDVRLFTRLSALDNVMLAVRQVPGNWWHWPSGSRGGESLVDLYFSPRVSARVERETREKAHECLRLVGLQDVAAVPAGALAFGQQKLVSLARLLATDAEVMLLDEPASGIDARWVDNILELVALMRQQGRTICIVEHSLHVVEQLADTVLFMELGQITARGTIRDLMRDPRLAEVYFGTV